MRLFRASRIEYEPAQSWLLWRLSSGQLTPFCSSILLKRLRKEPLPPSRFSLGKAAIPINVFAVLYVAVTCIASFFPAVNSPAVADMNWSCAMFGGVLLIACVDYALRGRKHYVEPARHLNKM
jgi:choline transport protein